MNRSWHRAHAMPKRATAQQRLGWHLAHQKYCGCRPVPAALANSAGAQSVRRRRPLRPFLSGGDRRSVAQSEVALAAVLANPKRLGELVGLAEGPDWLVSMRALDVLEKLAHRRPDWVQPFRRLFIGVLADSDQWEVRLQIVRALPLLTWRGRERRRAVEILLRDVEHPRLFVRAWALDSLAAFARHDAALAPKVERHLRAFETSNRKALQARAHHIRASLRG